MGHHVINTAPLSDSDSVIGTAIINHEPLDATEPINLPREIRDSVRQSCFFVETGDLSN